MLHSRRIPRRNLIVYASITGTQGLLWAALVYAAYTFGGLEWLRIPWMPVSVVGIAVSFYVGFKNNSSYDRFWEGRKIWGGIVNESRSWASQVLCYVLPEDDTDRANEIRKVLVYRQLAWINALRLQLRSTSRLHDKPARGTKKRLEKHAEVMRNDWETEISPFLVPSEFGEVSQMANAATHIVHLQGKTLVDLLEKEEVNLFHQIALMDILRELYTLQGKAERIKKTPLPRQYAEFSRLFTRAFVFFMPFGLLDVFSEQIPSGVPTLENAVWLVPYFTAAAVISWVFLTMEGIGDASEDPFERSMNDVPMNALCVVIERDLRQLLGEEQIPPPESPVDGILY